MPPAVPNLNPWGTRARAILGAGVGVAVAGLLTLLRGTAGVEGLELRLVDVRTRAFVGQREPDPRIVLAVILEADHASVLRSNVGAGEHWPWGLPLHTYAMRGLRAAGVRNVVVDLLHLERGVAPEDTNFTEQERAQGWFQAVVSEARLGGLAEGEARSPDDTTFALQDAYAALGSVALAYQLAPESTPNTSLARMQAAEGRLCPAIPFDPAAGLSMPFADLPLNRPARGAALLAFANVISDGDTIFRRAVPFGFWDDKPSVSLAFAGAMMATEGARSVEGDVVRLGAAAQHLDEAGGFFVNFRAEPRKAYREVSPADLVQWGVWVEEERPIASWPPEAQRKAAALQGAIVVYGAHLAGAKDVVTTPLSGEMLGPEYQATIMDNLLHGDGRVRVPRLVNSLVLVGACLLAGALGAALKGRLLPNLPPLMMLALVVTLGWWAFGQGHVLDLLTPVAGLVLTWGGTSVVRLATEGRRNRWLEGTFGRYVSPEIVEALKKDPTLLALGGRRRDLTILFSDIAGFTRISESQEAENVVRLLNIYLTSQSAEVKTTSGVIDKFVGDALMAFWGDPIEMPDHALRAVKTALRSQQVLPELEPRLEALGLPSVKNRIGINSGTALVGNMGSEERFDYTSIGDTVNLASRLEGANKAFGSTLLVGPLTYLQVKDHVVAKRLADLVVVGRSAPVRVYEVLSLREDASEDTLAHAAAFQRAHEALRKDTVEAAEDALAEAARRRPGDGPTAWLASVAAKIRAGAIPSPWDGTWTLTEK